MGKDIFTEAEQQKIREAIQEAELNTTGELKVHIERKLLGSVMDRASAVFEQLNLYDTKFKNGVLIYLAIEAGEFALLGDTGINAKVPNDFWNRTSLAMLELFREGNYVEGLIHGAKEVGVQLKAHFP